MRDSLIYLSLFLFGLAVVTMVLIVREVLPLLSPEDQSTFVIYGAGRGRASNQAIFNAWNEHVRSFPDSKKRLMFISFVVAGFIAFLSYPLWHTFVK
jgi:hypothetical protein